MRVFSLLFVFAGAVVLRGTTHSLQDADLVGGSVDSAIGSRSALATEEQDDAIIQSRIRKLETQIDSALSLIDSNSVDEDTNVESIAKILDEVVLASKVGGDLTTEQAQQSTDDFDMTAVSSCIPVKMDSSDKSVLDGLIKTIEGRLTTLATKENTPVAQQFLLDESLFMITQYKAIIADSEITPDECQKLDALTFGSSDVNVDPVQGIDYNENTNATSTTAPSQTEIQSLLTTQEQQQPLKRFNNGHKYRHREHGTPRLTMKQVHSHLQTFVDETPHDSETASHMVLMEELRAQHHAHRVRAQHHAHRAHRHPRHHRHRHHDQDIADDASTSVIPVEGSRAAARYQQLRARLTGWQIFGVVVASIVGTPLLGYAVYYCFQPHGGDIRYPYKEFTPNPPFAGMDSIPQEFGLCGRYNCHRRVQAAFNAMQVHNIAFGPLAPGTFRTSDVVGVNQVMLGVAASDHNNWWASYSSTTPSAAMTAQYYDPTTTHAVALPNAVTAIANVPGGGGAVYQISSLAHGLAVGDVVTLAGGPVTGTYAVTVAPANTFRITRPAYMAPHPVIGGGVAWGTAVKHSHLVREYVQRPGSHASCVLTGVTWPTAASGRATCNAPHPFVVGHSVNIQGAALAATAGLVGVKAITAINFGGGNNFDFVMAAVPGAPLVAAGTAMLEPVAIANWAAAAAVYYGYAEFGAFHGFVVGNVVTVAGANSANFNSVGGLPIVSATLKSIKYGPLALMPAAARDPAGGAATVTFQAQVALTGVSFAVGGVANLARAACGAAHQFVIGQTVVIAGAAAFGVVAGPRVIIAINTGGNNFDFYMNLAGGANFVAAGTATIVADAQHNKVTCTAQYTVQTAQAHVIPVGYLGRLVTVTGNTAHATFNDDGRITAFPAGNQIQFERVVFNRAAPGGGVLGGIAVMNTLENDAVSYWNQAASPQNNFLNAYWANAASSDATIRNAQFTSNGFTITVTMGNPGVPAAGNHFLSVGFPVRLAGAATAGYNGVYRVASVVSAQVFLVSPLGAAPVVPAASPAVAVGVSTYIQGAPMVAGVAAVLTPFAANAFTLTIGDNNQLEYQNTNVAVEHQATAVGTCAGAKLVTHIANTPALPGGNRVRCLSEIWWNAPNGNDHVRVSQYNNPAVAAPFQANELPPQMSPQYNGGAVVPSCVSCQMVLGRYT